MKKRAFIKVVSLFMAIAMMCTVLSACGGGNESSVADPSSESSQEASTTDVSTPGDDSVRSPDCWFDEPLKITMLYRENQAYDKNWYFLDALERTTNVTFEMTLASEADYLTKVSMLMAGGDLPDFLTRADLFSSEYALNGLLLNFNNYSDKLPFFHQAVEEVNVQNEIDNITELDGGLYYIPSIRVDLPNYNGLGIRMDKLEEWGMEVPKTVDDLYEYLKKWKEENPDGVAMTSRGGFDGFSFFFAPVYGVYAGWSADNGTFYDTYADEYALVYTHPRYREMLRFTNKLYEEGLFDPESFTQDDSQFLNKIGTGVAGAGYIWNGDSTRFKDMIGDENAEFNAIPPLSALEGIKGTTDPYSHLKNAIAMPADAPERERFDDKLKFLDWFMNSSESCILGHFGIEGETYQLRDDGSYERIGEAATNPKGVQNGLGFCNNSFNGATPMAYEVETGDTWIIPNTEYLTEHDLFGKVTPKAKFTVDEMEEIKLIATPLKDYCAKMEQEFVFGTKDIDADWDAFVAECQARGADDLVARYNATLEK
jgi:putative aldouronate transport system substrate-binding protein